jgi:hypothetical protein
MLTNGHFLPCYIPYALTKLRKTFFTNQHNVLRLSLAKQSDLNTNLYQECIKRPSPDPSKVIPAMQQRAKNNN